MHRRAVFAACVCSRTAADRTERAAVAPHPWRAGAGVKATDRRAWRQHHRRSGTSADSRPALLQRRIDKDGLNYEVVNAGVSGDTSAGGLSRLDWALDGDVRVLIVALGGNDALRALPPGELQQNLSTIIERAQAKHIAVVLAGMEAPRNFGHDYIVRFHQVYPDLAKKYNVVLVPFLLQDVAGIERLNQRDGIHPTAEGAEIVAGNIWKALQPLVATSRS
jgi:acyl-CoA thioesterase-1